MSSSNKQKKSMNKVKKERLKCNIYSLTMNIYMLQYLNICELHFYLFGKRRLYFGWCWFVCLSVCLWTTLLKTLWTDWDEILWRDPGWYNEELFKFWWWSRSSQMNEWAKNTIIALAWPDCGAGNDPEPLGLVFHPQGSTFYSGQYGSNNLPWPRRSALSECF